MTSCIGMFIMSKQRGRCHASLSLHVLPGALLCVCTGLTCQRRRAPYGNFKPVLAKTAKMSLNAVIVGIRLKATNSQSFGLAMFFFFLRFPLQTSKNQIKVDLVDENFTELKGEIAGPPDTPYEGKY